MFFPGLYSKQNYFQGDKIGFLFIHFLFHISVKTNSVYFLDAQASLALTPALTR